MKRAGDPIRGKNMASLQMSQSQEPLTLLFRNLLLHLALVPLRVNYPVHKVFALQSRADQSTSGTSTAQSVGRTLILLICACSERGLATAQGTLRRGRRHGSSGARTERERGSRRDRLAGLACVSGDHGCQGDTTGACYRLTRKGQMNRQHPRVLGHRARIRKGG